MIETGNLREIPVFQKAGIFAAQLSFVFWIG